MSLLQAIKDKNTSYRWLLFYRFGVFKYWEVI